MGDYADARFQRMMSTNDRLYGGTAGRRKRGEYEPDAENIPDISKWNHYTPAQLEELRRRKNNNRKLRNRTKA